MSYKTGSMVHSYLSKDELSRRRSPPAFDINGDSRAWTSKTRYGHIKVMVYGYPAFMTGTEIRLRLPVLQHGCQLLFV